MNNHQLHFESFLDPSLRSSEKQRSSSSRLSSPYASKLGREPKKNRHVVSESFAGRNHNDGISNRNSSSSTFVTTRRRQSAIKKHNQLDYDHNNSAITANKSYRIRRRSNMMSSNYGENANIARDNGRGTIGSFSSDGSQGNKPDGKWNPDQNNDLEYPSRIPLHELPRNTNNIAITNDLRSKGIRPLTESRTMDGRIIQSQVSKDIATVVTTRKHRARLKWTSLLLPPKDSVRTSRGARTSFGSSSARGADSFFQSDNRSASSTVSGNTGKSFSQHDGNPKTTISPDNENVSTAMKRFRRIQRMSFGSTSSSRKQASNNEHHRSTSSSLTGIFEPLDKQVDDTSSLLAREKKNDLVIDTGISIPVWNDRDLQDEISPLTCCSPSFGFVQERLNCKTSPANSSNLASNTLPSSKDNINNIFSEGNDEMLSMSLELECSKASPSNNIDRSFGGSLSKTGIYTESCIATGNPMADLGTIGLTSRNHTEEHSANPDFKIMINERVNLNVSDVHESNEDQMIVSAFSKTHIDDAMTESFDHLTNHEDSGVFEFKVENVSSARNSPCDPVLDFSDLERSNGFPRRSSDDVTSLASSRCNSKDPVISNDYGRASRSMNVTIDRLGRRHLTKSDHAQEMFPLYDGSSSEYKKQHRDSNDFDKGNNMLEYRIGASQKVDESPSGTNSMEDDYDDFLSARSTNELSRISYTVEEECPILQSAIEVFRSPEDFDWRKEFEMEDEFVCQSRRKELDLAETSVFTATGLESFDHPPIVNKALMQSQYPCQHPEHCFPPIALSGGGSRLNSSETEDCTFSALSQDAHEEAEAANVDVFDWRSAISPDILPRKERHNRLQRLDAIDTLPCVRPSSSNVPVTPKISEELNPLAIEELVAAEENVNEPEQGSSASSHPRVDVTEFGEVVQYQSPPKMRGKTVLSALKEDCESTELSSRRVDLADYEKLLVEKKQLENRVYELMHSDFEARAKPLEGVFEELRELRNENKELRERMKETEQIHDSIRKQMTDVVPAALAKIQVLVGQLEELKAKNKQLEVQLLGLRQENTDLKNFRGEI